MPVPAQAQKRSEWALELFGSFSSRIGSHDLGDEGKRRRKAHHRQARVDWMLHFCDKNTLLGVRGAGGRAGGVLEAEKPSRTLAGG